MGCFCSNDCLEHHGIKGQKWGIRRFQNKDGSYTAAGKKRRDDDTDSNNASTSKKKGLTNEQKSKLKRAAVIGAAAIGTGLAAYGGYKLSKTIKTKAMKNIVDLGNAKATELIKKAGEYRVLAGSPFPGLMNRHTLFTQKAVNAESKAVEERKKAVEDANRIGKSLFESLKYMSENGDNSKIWDDLFKSIADPSAKAPTFEQVFGGNVGSVKMKDLSMRDLSKLDLY